ncbi:MAG: (Fe-S)-binding protein [Dehalococcoidia bacterium]|nr:MAG: (Fe-S)-binding protein [Dehalococcoidia bacterium]
MVQTASREARGPLTQAFFDRIAAVAEGEKLKACIQCGICSGSCPLGFAMQYPPRRLIASLRAGVMEQVLQSNTPWLCVACYTCTARCPSAVGITDMLFPAMREALLMQGVGVPGELQTALENTFRHGNPLGEPPSKRADWIQEVDVPVTDLSADPREVDILWLVECYPAYHVRAKETVKALARTLHALGADFGVLGQEERCVGDSQRLVGENGLFEMLVEENGKTLDRFQFRQIIVTDPHAYNALKNEYPKYGVNYPVQHYTQYLASRLEELRPMLGELNHTITFHDPCYLGRRNGEYEAPRQLIQAIPGVTFVEMERNRENGLCCGGGGGGMWLDSFAYEYAKERLSEKRVREAARTGADVMAVCCPNDLLRFEDAVKVVGLEGKLVVKDIIELIDEARKG